jgi:hypothetical protein
MVLPMALKLPSSVAALTRHFSRQLVKNAKAAQCSFDMASGYFGAISKTCRFLCTSRNGTANGIDNDIA